MISDLDPLAFARHKLVDQLAVYSSTTSTNEIARRYAPGLAQHRTLLVVAAEQTNGRGRGENSWWSGEGSLSCSLLFDPEQRGIIARNMGLVPLSAALAIARVAGGALPDAAVGIHWPNDVFANGRKLAGVLVETMPDGRCILGFGVNVNNRAATAPAALGDIATSLADIGGMSFHRTEFLRELLDELASKLELLADNPPRLAHEANELCLQRGHRVTIDTGKENVVGYCSRIADDGALILDLPGGERAIYSGANVRGA